MRRHLTLILAAALAAASLSPALAQGNRVNLRDPTDAPLGVAANPLVSSNPALNTVKTAAVASSLVLKASAGSLYFLDATAGASAGYVLVFDATSAPADGAVTPTLCWPVAANAGIRHSLAAPISFATGITAVFSTTGCFTKTASATAFIAGGSR